MSSEKKDLTRIEDLGEFLHELSAEDENESFESPVDLPDLPEDSESAEESFGSDFSTEENTFGEPFESENTFEESTDFTSDSTFDSETSFETETSFDEVSSDFEASFDEPIEAPVQEAIDNPIEDEVINNDDFLSSLEEEKVEEPIREIEPVAPPIRSEYKAPENFQDLKTFAENTNYSQMGAEGNPSFSVLVKNVQFIEDVNDILILLKELNLLLDSEDIIKQRLMRGNLLIPRISEYAAIFLSHKLRKFDVDIQVGLSDEIHPPKHASGSELGILSKQNLQQNQTHHFSFDHSKLDISQIIVSASPQLEGFEVVRYLGVASEHAMINGELVEEENNDEIPQLYTELAQKLKAHALKAHANAIVALNYQLTPLPSEFGLSNSKYRISCTGNLVWVNKR